MTVTTPEQAPEAITGYSTMIWAARHMAHTLISNRGLWRLLVADRHAGCEDARRIDLLALYPDAFNEDTARDFLELSSAWLHKRLDTTVADFLKETKTS